MTLEALCIILLLIVVIGTLAAAGLWWVLRSTRRSPADMWWN